MRADIMANEKDLEELKNKIAAERGAIISDLEAQLTFEEAEREEYKLLVPLILSIAAGDLGPKSRRQVVTGEDPDALEENAGADPDALEVSAGRPEDPEAEKKALENAVDFAFSVLSRFSTAPDFRGRLSGYILQYAETLKYGADDPENAGKIPAAAAEIIAGSDNLHTQLEALAKYGLMNDKVDRILLNTAPDVRDLSGQISLQWVINQAGSSRAPVPVYIALTDEGNQLKTSRKITGADDAVFTTVANMIYSAQQHGIAAPYNFTPEDIWRTMHGYSGTNRRVSDNQKKEIENSLDKMRFTRLYMDISQEIQAYHLAIKDNRLIGGTFDGYYLPAEKLTFLNEKGRRLSGYQFYKMPFLQTYNAAKGNIVLVDYSLLDTSDTTGDEGNTAQFRLYLLREIALMYNGFRNSNRILYDTIYQAAAIPSPEESTQRSDYKTEESYNAVIRRKAKDDRDKIAALLESWKKKKYILDYTPVKKGRAFVGIDIKLNPDNYETPPAIPEK